MTDQPLPGGIYQPTFTGSFRQAPSQTIWQIKMDEAATATDSTATPPRPAHPWTSTLSVSGLSLAALVDWTVLGTVSGNATYQAASGNDLIPVGANLEARHLVESYYSARDLAMQRLTSQAAALGAHMVVGVRHQWRRERDGWRIHVTFMGTAVRLSQVPAIDRAIVVNPLSMGDTYRLITAGYLPIGYALGYSHRIVPVPPRWWWQVWLRARPLTAVGRGLEACKTDALARTRRDLADSGGLLVTHRRHHIEPTALHFPRPPYGTGPVNIDGFWYLGIYRAYHVDFWAEGVAI